MEKLHTINILVHVFAGTIALITGFIAIGTRKGGRNHVKAGRMFLRIISLVILTGLLGVFVFQRNTFLLVITLLSGYTAYSGLRALRLRGSKPGWKDYFIPAIVLASGIYYLYYISSIGMFWQPSVTYSTLGALAFVTLYDIGKLFIPASFLQRVFVQEHVYKMTSSLIALVSAFTGTVLPQYKPYSQLLPTVFGLAYIVGVFIWLGSKSRPQFSFKQS